MAVGRQIERDFHRRCGENKRGGSLWPPSWGGGNRETRPRSPPAASLRFSLVEVLPLERLRFREGPFRILHLLELLGDELHARIHEVPDRGPNGLRPAREIVDLYEEIESLQIPRGQAQRDFFRVRIPHARHPTRRSTRHVLTDERRTEQSRAI